MNCNRLALITTFSVMTMLSKTEAMRLRYNALVVVSNCNGCQQHRATRSLKYIMIQHELTNNLSLINYDLVSVVVVDYNRLTTTTVDNSDKELEIYIDID